MTSFFILIWCNITLFDQKTYPIYVSWPKTNVKTTNSYSFRDPYHVWTATYHVRYGFCLIWRWLKAAMPRTWSPWGPLLFGLILFSGETNSLRNSRFFHLVFGLLACEANEPILLQMTNKLFICPWTLFRWSTWRQHPPTYYLCPLPHTMGTPYQTLPLPPHRSIPISIFAHSLSQGLAVHKWSLDDCLCVVLPMSWGHMVLFFVPIWLRL